MQQPKKPASLTRTSAPPITTVFSNFAFPLNPQNSHSSPQNSSSSFHNSPSSSASNSSQDLSLRLARVREKANEVSQEILMKKISEAEKFNKVRKTVKKRKDKRWSLVESEELKERRRKIGVENFKRKIEKMSDFGNVIRSCIDVNKVEDVELRRKRKRKKRKIVGKFAG
jgi:hypothetical protein